MGGPAVIIVLFIAMAVVIALNESILAIYCLRRYRSKRLVAFALLLTAPLQVLSAVFGERLVMAWHTPSSVDSPADGFALFIQYLALTFGFALLSISLAMWLAIWLFFKGGDPVSAGSR